MSVGISEDPPRNPAQAPAGWSEGPITSHATSSTLVQLMFSASSRPHSRQVSCPTERDKSFLVFNVIVRSLLVFKLPGLWNIRVGAVSYRITTPTTRGIAVGICLG